MNTEVPIDAAGKVYHLDCTREDIAPNVILVGDPGRVPKVSGLFDEGSIRFKSSNREIVIHTGAYKGVPVTTLSTGMGTDNTEIVLTELHILYEFNHKDKTWAKPATPINLIRCGTCGCPHADVTPGTLAVTQLSIGMDNTGTFYNDVPPRRRHAGAYQVYRSIPNQIYPSVRDPCRPPGDRIHPGRRPARKTAPHGRWPHRVRLRFLRLPGA